MEQFIRNIKENINKEIQLIDSEECNIFQKSISIISLLESTFDELKEFVSNYTFKSTLDEITFFKETKPQLFSILIYHRKVYNLEMRMPTGSYIDRKNYLEGMLGRIKYFFDNNADFYQYYRSGSTHLDKYYFLRGKPDIQLILDCFYFERDSRFSTSFDFKVAKMIANERLTVYINNKLLHIGNIESNIQEVSSLPKTRLSWTAKKAELVEQIYAWDSAGCFNNGNTNIKELAEYIETVFNINLGDFYHTFLEIRERKGSRTLFLDKMIKFLEERMSGLDNK
ncbi:RteC domain-containing protein [Dysgonomonas mossii]|uniref:RteC protein n=1 Tax=Dysgonomonas mossii TaxID=163665 RepID=A0A4Y9IIK6_9BACT|nr:MULTISPECIES: RteC domain-containing protein [Dysgonomonas]MBD8388075.1 RteC domain-containing protein [Dysgonomonas sp. BGC7]MBF0762512.1 RteC domain-containing protein [Dysgonomonas mossii]TFU87177.1 hypothetical protein E4T88_15800 [Dysgonomonas mossii]